MLVRLGTTDDVAPGEMRVFGLAGTNVTIANIDGVFYGFDDACTHAGCSLANGDLDGKTVTCACHGSQFDVTSGAVQRGPAQRPVRSRRTEVRDKDVLVEW